MISDELILNIISIEYDILIFLLILKFYRYDLSKAELEKGKYTLAEDDLIRQRSALQEQGIDDYHIKKKKEDAYVEGNRNLLQVLYRSYLCIQINIKIDRNIFDGKNDCLYLLATSIPSLLY